MIDETIVIIIPAVIAILVFVGALIKTRKNRHKPEPGPHIPTKNRPIGLAIISVLWFLGGIINLYNASTSISVDIDLLPILLELPEWFSFAVPIEIVLSIVIFGLGLIQMYEIYGLWTGKSWAYNLGFLIMILLVVIQSLVAVLYSTCPDYLVYAFDIYPNILGVIGSLAGLGIIYWYFRKPHVREYLGVGEDEVEEDG